MAKFQELYGNFVMVGLMVLALFALVVTIQGQNDAAQPLIDDELFSSTYGNLSGTMRSLEGISTSRSEEFFTEKPAPGFASIVLLTIVSVGKTFGNLVFVMFTLIIKLPLIVLGIDQAITSMILSFLTISVIIALWIVYKFGG